MIILPSKGFAIYDQSRYLGWTPTFRDGIKIVRTLAHADGTQGPGQFERPAGRVSYKRGIYRVVSIVKGKHT